MNGLTDIFTSADGVEFWTRPVNIYVLTGSLVPIRYITSGATTGSVQLDRYGRGEQHAGDELEHPSISNCDPFLKDSIYAEPTYDPYWYCVNPPNWENVICVPSAADVRRRVARSIGMMISVEMSEAPGVPHIPILSTCSVTLIDMDKVITAGHCHTPEEALTSSVTFDYQTDCAGSRPPSYNAHFYKVKAVFQHRWDGVHVDYSLLRLATAPAGIPAIQMRHDIPAPGEQVFGIHHPNGAIKKLSIPHSGFATVLASNSDAVNVPSNFHVSGGSSGSGLFDTAGRIVGVLSNGGPCSGNPLIYYPTASILLNIAPAPPPTLTRDVMLVFDRSGSMSLDEGTGRTKIEVARDAVSLFVQLVRAGTGNRVGLLSFSTTASSPTDFNITSVTNSTKNILIGSAPYPGGKVGGLAPGGATSIGEGLDAARLQFPTPGANPRSILLLTDGLQNTPHMVNEVEGSLAGIAVHAIGFGTEASLDGSLLTGLSTRHDGLYTRAGSGLALEKFFSHAFGNIFETGVLVDPEFDLPAKQLTGSPFTFRVCGEETITVVVGWDRIENSLLVEVTTPGGATISAGLPDVESSSGRSWTFLRFNLPHGGERDGIWTVRVFRPGGGGEFPPPAPALRYFINVIPTGGPRLAHLPKQLLYYTGDSINPLVILRYANGGWPNECTVQLVVSHPNEGIGNLLSRAGLQAPITLDADTISSRQATLQMLEHQSGQPIVHYTDTDFDFSDDTTSTGGVFEASGIFGKVLTDLFTVDGNYTFHAKATYGTDCVGTRELAWTISVEVGIDPSKTSVQTEPIGTRPDGSECMHMTFTPRDRYGNQLGPGRSDAFELKQQPGSTLVSGIQDLGNGSYQVDICWDPVSTDPPRIGLVQPERSPVIVGPTEADRHIYSVIFVCGE